MAESKQLTDVQIAQKYINKSNNAMVTGKEFTLTFSDFKKLMLRKTCYYTGIKLQDSSNNKGSNSRTLDRIDSTKGYTKENTVACSHFFNQLKAITENPNNEITMGTIKRGVNKQ